MMVIRLNIIRHHQSAGMVATQKVPVKASLAVRTVHVTESSPPWWQPPYILLHLLTPFFLLSRFPDFCAQETAQAILYNRSLAIRDAKMDAEFMEAVLSEGPSPPKAPPDFTGQFRGASQGEHRAQHRKADDNR